MNMRQIEVFRKVMETGTTSAAATALHISQPAVSNMIRHMEMQIGFELFKRDKGRLRPTAEAKALYREADHMFQLFLSVQQKILDLKNATAGHIRIAATPSVGHSIVPIALGKFLEDRPDVTFSIDIERTEAVGEHVFHGLAEIGVTAFPVEQSGILCEPIHMGAMVCVMPPSHPLTKQQSVRPHNLSDYRLVALTRGSPFGELVNNAFINAGVEYKWAIETTDTNSACSLAININGVAVVDQYTAQRLHPEEMVVRPFLPTIQLSVYLLTSTQHAVSNLSKKFIENLESLYFQH